MHNCELFYVRGGKDFEILKENIQTITTFLYQNDINVKFQTDVPSIQSKITSALNTSVDDEDLNYVIFANALTSKDSSSFKSLFYEYIHSKEEELNTEKEAKILNKIKISSLGDLGNGYRGYCFTINNTRVIVLPKAKLCDKDNLELIKNGIFIANTVFQRNDIEAPNGIKTVETTKKKEGFFKSLFPQKSDSKKTKAKKIGVLIAIIAIIFALGYLINYFIIAPLMNNKINSEIQEIAYSTSNDGDNKNGPEQDWNALKQINDEIVGWINLPGTIIDYPVLEHIGDDSSSQYYLYRTYKKEWSVYGCCFVDYRSTDSTKSKNVIIHGHNMNDGSMFHELMNYGDLWGDLDYYKEHPIIKFNTPDGDARWKIISVFKTNTLYQHGEFFNYMQGEFTSDAEFMNFVYNCKIRSVFNTPVVVNESDQLLTLSTCSYEFSNFRTVVVARKVREGESDKVDVSLATKNDAIYPDVYYWRYGGERPTVSSFKKAYKKGEISWYDGKGNLKGDETLTGTVAANPTEPPSEKSNDGNTTESSAQSTTFYTVNYRDYDGEIFESFSVREGDKVPYPESTPTRPSDENWVFTFDHWQTEDFDMEHCRYGMDIAPYFTWEPIDG